MDEKRTDLRASLRELAEESVQAGNAGDTGPHPGTKRLIAYRQGTLPAAEREALQEHLSLCPRCTGLLRELRDFEAAAARGDAAGPESLREEAWESLVERLPRKGSVIRPITGGRRQAPPPRRAPYLAYGAAAALLLAVLGLAVWAVLTVRQERQRLALVERRLEDREQELAAARRSLGEAQRRLATAREQAPSGRVAELEKQVAELTSDLEALRRARPKGRDQLAAAVEVSIVPRFSLRGQERTDFLQGDGAVNSVHLPASGDRFTVALSLGDQPMVDEYRFELLDRSGAVLWSGHQPAQTVLGDAGTSVSVSGLAPGLYRLRAIGLRAGRGEPGGEYLLDVER